MFQIIQEAAGLPKLSETSVYQKFDESSHITANVIAEIKESGNNQVKPKDINEILSLIKLNGSPIAKKAIQAYVDGHMVIIHNKGTSRVPTTLPFIIVNNSKKVPTVYLFTANYINNITSSQEYTKLMAFMEAAYIALALHLKPNRFLSNSSLMLMLCNVYMKMVMLPLQTRWGFSGDNQTKAYTYIIAFFYKMFKGDQISVDSIPFHRLLSDKLDKNILKQTVEQVKSLPDASFNQLLQLITNINPYRYDKTYHLKESYMSQFFSTCGKSLLFALENLGYLFLAVSSANYKTQITVGRLNENIKMFTKRVITMMNSVCSIQEGDIMNVGFENFFQETNTPVHFNELTWKYVKPLKTEKLISEYEQLIDFKLSTDFVDIVKKYNGGRPSMKTFDTSKQEGKSFKSLLSFNREDRETVWNIWQSENYADKKIAPFGITDSGDTLCFKNNAVVLFNHETEEIEKVANNFNTFLSYLY